MKLLTLLLLLNCRLTAQGPDGNDISTAIPIYFGQVVQDIGDGSLAPNRLYRVTLGRGQKFTTTVTSGQGTPGWNVVLLRPSTTTVKRLTEADFLACGAGNCGGFYSEAALTFDYQVPSAGDYYLWVHLLSNGVNYKLAIKAEGIPIDTPLPPEAGCVSGLVDYITFSLKFLALNLPDDLSIGGTKVCPTCTAKPPLYSAIVEKLEGALKSNIAVDACYDSSGNIQKVRLLRP